jgi:2,4-dienoyl-CoA reductase-like NADH-dependent reductase (Old Yellow Enzyme family)
MSTPEAQLRMFEPFTLKGVRFENRILRSAMGGKMCYYDGTVNNAWVNFERRFAQHDVGGIISTTMAVDSARSSPLEYPRISAERYVGPLRDGIKRIKDGTRCVYILQVGDPGYHTQTSLFSEKADGRTSSPVFDGLYGYRTFGTAMTEREIAHSIEQHVDGARRAREAGADGVEIAASKGYLIHQFLNPGINRRTDDYGGSPEGRFRFLREVVQGARAALGRDYLLGVRLSAIDHNYLPVNLRFPLRSYFRGNKLAQTLAYAQELEKLDVDYLHVAQGFGFINPKENPGAYPLDQIRIFANTTRHLSFKAALRAMFLNSFPDFILRPIMGLGWKMPKGENADIAAEFKKVLKIPVIANGGFQERDLIEQTLEAGKCDLVSMARPLLANPDLLASFRAGKNAPDKPCTRCNRCVVLTAVQPVGCYEPLRFADQAEMQRQVLRWSADPEP